MAPRSLPHNGSRSGPSLPRRVVGLGDVPPDPLPQGDSLWLAPSTYVMRQAPRKRSGAAARLLGILEHRGDIIAQPFVFGKEAEAGDGGAKR